MNTPSPINADPSRHPIVAMGYAVIAFARLLLFGVLMFFLAILIGMFGMLPRQGISGAQSWLVMTVMIGSGLAIVGLAEIRPRVPDRASWIRVHAGIIAIAYAAWIWLPQEAGFVAAAVSLLAWTPWVLAGIASRRARAGYTGAAAFYLRLACILHPSGYMRFRSALWDAHALGQIERKVVAYRALAQRASSEQFSLLNLYIRLAYGDWEGVLVRICSVDEMLPAMKWLAIWALGELGRVDDMVKTYASLGPELFPIDIQICRLYILGFGGRIDGVRALLGRQLAYLRPSSKAYWVSWRARQPEPRMRTRGALWHPTRVSPRTRRSV